MQGLSESWAVEGWLADEWHRLQAASEGSTDAMDPELVRFIAGHPYPPKVAAVRMEYLLRGDRRESEPGRWANQSPLIRGYRRSIGGLRFEYAWSCYWSCREPHSMRKSKWYPDGQCPGDGRRHKIADDFEPFEVWRDAEVGGIAGWIEMLASGKVQPEAGDALEQQLVLLPPVMRHQSDIERWARQVSAQEARVAEHAWRANELLEAGRLDELEDLLDEHFVMHTAACDYPVPCAFQELCWNPEAARDPLATGLYAWREPHHEAERERYQHLRSPPPRRPERRAV